MFPIGNTVFYLSQQFVLLLTIIFPRILVHVLCFNQLSIGFFNLQARKQKYNNDADNDRYPQVEELKRIDSFGSLNPAFST